jgi:hypothetical protein
METSFIIFRISQVWMKVYKLSWEYKIKEKIQCLHIVMCQKIDIILDFLIVR